jgi:tetratricopeptide (TPR) repeat protein
MTRLVLALVFVACFSLATVLDSRLPDSQAQTDASTGVMAVLLGESRRMFANQLFVEADVYFHSGYYPTMFDKQETDMDVKGEPEGGQNQEGKDGGKADVEETFLGEPLDWMERFGRHFFPTVHTHLDDERAREVLPWLRMAADMDPHQIETYLTAAYWLRGPLHKPDEAEQFLREGLRANPDSFEIYLELGYVDDFSRHDFPQARRLYELALKMWEKQQAAGRKPDPKARGEVLDGLVRADRELKDYPQMLTDLEALKAVSPTPEAIEKTIQETRAKLAAPGGAPPGQP